MTQLTPREYIALELAKVMIAKGNSYTKDIIHNSTVYADKIVTQSKEFEELSG